MGPQDAHQPVGRGSLQDGAALPSANRADAHSKLRLEFGLREAKVVTELKDLSGRETTEIGSGKGDARALDRVELTRIEHALPACVAVLVREALDRIVPVAEAHLDGCAAQPCCLGATNRAHPRLFASLSNNRLRHQ
jgi:hypothetical protein